MCPKMAGGEGVMPHLHLARGERKDRECVPKQPNQMEINNPTQRGQKQQVETGHKAEQDLGCKTAGGGGGADWKDKMVDAHVGLETEGK